MRALRRLDHVATVREPVTLPRPKMSTRIEAGQGQKICSPEIRYQVRSTGNSPPTRLDQPLQALPEAAAAWARAFFALLSFALARALAAGVFAFLTLLRASVTFLLAFL